MKYHFMKTIMFCILVLFCCAQKVEAINELYPLEPPDTSSPRSTLQVFMETMNKAYQKQLIRGYSSEKVDELLDHAAQCLDLSGIPPTTLQQVKEETALLLKEVLDRIEMPSYKEIPDQNVADFAFLRNWNVPHTAITIVKIEEGPQG